MSKSYLYLQYNQCVIMRLLFFFTFLTAILFSEVVSHVISWEYQIVSEYDMAGDESNESENSEESKEDNVEEDKLFEDLDFVAIAISLTISERPCSNSILLSQSLREIHSPPPDQG